MIKNFIFSQILDPTPFPKAKTTNFVDILNVIFVTMGALAVFMLVLAGLRYVTSGGSPEKTADAKRQIVYTLVGLVVIALAGTIVNFVLVRFI